MTAFRFSSPEEFEPGTRTIEVPAYLAHKRDLLDFLARAFPLPAYFGHNWDALEECLRLAHVKALGITPTAAGIAVARGKATYNLIDAEAFRGGDKEPDREHDAAVSRQSAPAPG